MSASEHEGEGLQRLLHSQEQVLGRLAKIESATERPKSKDNWDKFSVIASLLTPVLVAALGVYLTHLYDQREKDRDAVLKQRQQQVQELQTIAQFMQYMFGTNEEAKRYAIVEVQRLGGTQAAADLAVLRPSLGVQAGLETIRTHVPTAADSELITIALREVSCGLERGKVKTLSDNARDSVQMTPQATTVTALRALERPARILPETRVGEVEHRAYRVRALLLGYKQEADQDFRMVISDPSDTSTSMFAEIPSPACPGAKVSGFAEQYLTARQAVVEHVGAPGLQVTRLAHPVPVTLVGIGFFDFPHGQRGAARNGIELHPVLSIEFSAPNQ
jgi:hypothetical protein